jgi:hypothetical protein
MIDRDPVEMDMFATAITEYCERIKTVSTQLEATAQAANECIKSNNSAAAAGKISYAAIMIRNQIPELEDLSARITKSAAPLHAANDIRF